MLLVKTRLGASSIHGLGVFAEQDIPKGTRIWQFVAGLDRTIEPETLEAVDDTGREFLHRYAHWSEGDQKYYLSFDHDRFMNHSDEPNVVAEDTETASGESPMRAARDIRAGEELLCDYREIGCHLVLDN